MPRFNPDPDTIYLGDHGHAYCGAHLGATAEATGRDLSGQEIHAVTPEDARYALEEIGHRLDCETCGKEARLIHTAKGA